MKKFLLLIGYILSHYCVGAQELCNNNIDDDGDSLVDCYDPDCPCFCTDSSSNHWYFGNNAGINFSTGGIATGTTNGAMSASEGISTISDKNGNLLFYTNGLTVWNANHAVMSNGTGLRGSNISAQSSIIVPAPNSNTLYYIFTVPNWTDATAARVLAYSVVDMSLNSGLGAVTATKNVVIHTNIVEQVSAAYHTNCQDIWIVSHERDNSNFVAFQVSPTGINTTPRISNIGPVNTGSNRYGGLRFSHDGKKLCSTLGGSTTLATVTLFDFDASTGIVSNPLILADANAYPHAYSSEFSSDNQVLYVCEFNDRSIFQYDLSLPSSLIRASATNIAPCCAQKSALQMGPDKKIYVAYSGRAFLGVISNPNALGAGCNYIDNAVNLLGRRGRLGLPNFFPANLEEELYISGPKTVCPSSAHSYHTNVKRCLSYDNTWSVLGNATIHSTQDSAVTLSFGDEGVDTLIVVQTNACDTLTDTLLITVSCTSPICATTPPSLNLGNDTTVCAIDSLILDASKGGLFSSYLWQDGSTDSVFVAKTGNTFHVRGTSFCNDVLRDTIVVNTVGCNLLDVDWEYYEVEKYQATKSQLSWKLHTPSTYTAIEIQRSSNGQLFETIANAINPNKNSYIDFSPLVGDNYYRLKLFHQDGTYSYTAIKHLHFLALKNELLVLPNPFATNITIQLASSNNTTIDYIEIFNVLGQKFYSKRIPQENIVELFLDRIPSGTYWLKVRVGEQWLQRKIIKL